MNQSAYYDKILPVPVRMKGDLQLVNTPEALVEQMLDGFPAAVYGDPRVRWLVPFSKNGAFERRLGLRLFHGLRGIFPLKEDRIRYIVEEMIYSMCPTPATAEIVKRHWLGVIHNDPSKYWELEGNVEVRDFLSVKPEKDGSIMVKSTSGKEKKVKFDCVVGNPPYQIGIGKSARNFYPEFVMKALELNPQYVSMVIPARWMTGDGKGISGFVEKMLGSKHMSIIQTEQEGERWFPPPIEIAGGAMYFLLDRSKNNHIAKVNGVNVDLSKEQVVITDTIGLSIKDKIQAKCATFFDESTLKSNPYGIRPNHDEWVQNDENAYPCRIRGWACKYVSKSMITKHLDTIPKWKTCISKANGGNPTFQKVFIAQPNEIVSETFLVLSTHDTEQEAKSVADLFLRPLIHFLIFLLKGTQNMSGKTFKWVPYLDFTKTYSDQNLYAMFDLTKEEIEHVMTTVKDFPLFRIKKVNTPSSTIIQKSAI